MVGSNVDRRKIIGGGALVAGAGLVATATTAQETTRSSWTSSPEEIDAWMDIPGTRHRMVYDNTSASAFGEALFFAKNFYVANETGYGLKPDKLGIMIIARHLSTPLAYSDAAWAKYGPTLAKIAQLEGEDAELAKTRNPMFAARKGAEEGIHAGANISALAEKGTRFAVCGMATTLFAGMLAKDAGMSKDSMEAYLKANLVPGGVIVPAGIVAVNRAQEHGYAFAYIA